MKQIKIQQEYSKDFYAWAIHNAQLLRQGKLSEVDIENVAEEIESIGKQEKRELTNRLAILLAHLLKWQYQPVRRSKSWKCTIKEQRLELSDLLEESPSLKHEMEKHLAQAYKKALLIAEKETSFEFELSTNVCPFSLKKVLDANFFPEE